MLWTWLGADFWAGQNDDLDALVVQLLHGLERVVLSRDRRSGKVLKLKLEYILKGKLI